ncbi:MAG: hypothetical protein LBD81_01175 [Holosporaceae bacterium]|jgi:hypothetical protein|nr:hypothetical protein [Holosporaceae bacterium]
MKMWLVVAVVVSSVFCTEARKYYINNEASDSFDVSVTIGDPRVSITHLTTVVDPSRIVGRIEEPCGRGCIRCQKLYEVKFQEGYTPLPGEEPFISFRNDKGEFKLVFPDENYAELRSDMASEIHDDPQRREYDHLYTQSDLKTDVYEGYVRHWMVFGKYIAILGYDSYRFARRAIYICNSSADNSWVETVKESYDGRMIGLFLPPPPPRQKRHWWSRLFCCCDCDE